MLDILIDYIVPACVFMLMFISGTEIAFRDFVEIPRNFRAVVAGSAGVLLLLPLVALAVQAIAAPPPAVALGIMLLSLCPSGGISNYYCYLARSNVLLSAIIAAVGTALSLFTIPIWLQVLPALPSLDTFPQVPARIILLQLFVLMIVPMAIGILLRHRFAAKLQAIAAKLRWISFVIVLIVLALAIHDVFDKLSLLLTDILKSATLFIFLAMLLGWCLGYGLPNRDRSVITIESGVRNIGVALIVGSAMLSREGLGIFASFLTGYFIVEIVIMMGYARFQSSRQEEQE